MLLFDLHDDRLHSGIVAISILLDELPPAEVVPKPEITPKPLETLKFGLGKHAGWTYAVNVNGSVIIIAISLL